MSSRILRLAFFLAFGLIAVIGSKSLLSQGITSVGGLVFLEQKSLEWLTDAHENIGIYQIEKNPASAGGRGGDRGILTATLRGNPPGSLVITAADSAERSLSAERFLVFLRSGGSEPEVAALDRPAASVSYRTAFSAALRPITDVAEIEDIVRARMRDHTFNPGLANETIQTSSSYVSVPASAPPMALASIAGILVPPDLRYQTEHNDLYWKWITLKVRHPALVWLEALAWAMIVGAATILLLRANTFINTPGEPKEAEATPPP